MNSVNSSQLPLGEAEANYNPYPPPLNTYENVVGSREIFMDTLKQLHASMGTKFMIPIVGGRDLDLYRLFVEVTSRGGIAKVMKERKWKEITGVFNFPSSATNASFILRKYYVALLYHYEQIYFFKAKCWTPLWTDALQHGSTNTVPPASSEQTYAASRPEAGSPVCGVIDGKFESGYLITVKIGSEDFKGVLYQVPGNEAQTFSGTQMQRGSSVQITNYTSPKHEMPTRRKRRKKSEIRKRDPAHPKPNRSGYNFFFAEQHARLKPLYHGRDREISRMIGELWNKLQEPERAVYQEKALRDKERYKIEMEDYRERLKTGQIIRNAVPIQQQPEVNLGDYIEEINEANSYKSDKSNMEECGSVDKESDFGECSQVDMGLKNVNIEMLADEEAFELQTGVERVGQDDRNAVDDKENVVLAQDGISVPIEERTDS
ncbi:hypothetical protein RD792_009725 [Penstemon davidsonii]|uniref:Uncharacterized protein n=1 Tax=Penstemon davidsonii TaxID=160366 RepID=A0ABR0CZV4_9LAMI|nr:hypothetical protein RD792_009725 [Penstemon davidsonii]